MVLKEISKIRQLLPKKTLKKPNCSPTRFFLSAFFSFLFPNFSLACHEQKKTVEGKGERRKKTHFFPFFSEVKGKGTGGTRAVGL